MSNQQYSDNDLSKRDIPSFIEPRPPLISNPFLRPRPQKGMNLLELFEEDSDCEEPELVQVYLRLKPSNVHTNLYEVKSDRFLITALDTTTMGHGRRTQHNVSKMYTFSRIFGPEANQKEIFERVVKDNLKKLPNGHSFTLLTYGASGSGKTFTLMGTVAAPGLVPRSLEYVFRVVDAAQEPVYKPSDSGSEKLSYAAQQHELQFVKQLRHVSAPLKDKYRRMSVNLHKDLTASNLDLSSRTKYYVWVSFVEIYNEGIYDLLSTSDRSAASKLVIRENSNGNVYVKGATQVFVKTGEEAYDVMAAGKHNLQVAATGVNAHSSRSHCIFTITMLTETDAGCRISSVRLCDLAGCERVRRTRNAGARLAESRAINSSLHVLERCLRTLRRRQLPAGRDAVVPFRESKLTRLLGAGLSGARGEAVSVVITVNPAPDCAHETKQVLQLAAVARDIQVNNTVSEYSSLETSSNATIVSSSTEVLKLRTENERLHFELLQAQAYNKELVASMEEQQVESANTMKELVEEVKDMTKQYYESLMQLQRKEMAEMKEEYEARLSMMTSQAPHSEGTPMRSLQNKISQLMREIAILEEKLTAEVLARARAEEELQHLRVCIEERDENAYNDAEKNNEEVISLDEESEEDTEEQDVYNESLEPTFKKGDINRARLMRLSLANITASCDGVSSDENDDSLDRKSLESPVKENNRILELSGATLKDEDSDHDTYTSEIEESVTDAVKEVTGEGINKSVDNENFQKEDETKTFDFIDRTTYFISEPETILSSSKGIAEKSQTHNRGTYFVRTSQDVSKSDESTQEMSIAKDNNDTSVENDIKLKEERREDNLPLSDTIVNKILKSKSGADNSNSSLSQFEKLEMAANNLDSDGKQKNFDALSNIKILKEKKNYFDDNIPDKPTDVDIINPQEESNKEKKVYFDNLDVFDEGKNLLDRKNVCNLKNDYFRSPSIVKEENAGDLGPSTLGKLFGESLKRPDRISLIQKNILKNKNNSLDLFEDSPKIGVLKSKQDEVDNILTSINNIALSDLKQDNKPLLNEEPVQEEEIPAKPTADISSTDTDRVDNTLEAFEAIYKDISVPRATEFDVLVTQDINTSKEETHKEEIEVKRNKRKKVQTKKRDDKFANDNTGEQILMESKAKCESVGKPMMSLRLRRRGNRVDADADQGGVKLKDIVNLQEEFSDVTMDMPPLKKETKDIPSPVKADEEENVPPIQGIQSCPSKSVIRSRRKLFTPRVEPLEESLGDTGDSNERLRIPRPSYHRPRARRKL